MYDQQNMKYEETSVYCAAQTGPLNKMDWISTLSG